MSAIGRPTHPSSREGSLGFLGKADCRAAERSKTSASMRSAIRCPAEWRCQVGRTPRTSIMPG